MRLPPEIQSEKEAVLAQIHSTFEPKRWAHSEQPCKHPPQRLFCWTAFDGMTVVVCCQCRTILRGAI